MTQKGNNKATSEEHSSRALSPFEVIARSRLFSALVSLVVIVLVVIVVGAFIQGRNISFWPPSIGALPTVETQPTTPAIVTPTKDTTVTPNNTLSTSVAATNIVVRKSLHRIEFDYSDEPTENGWKRADDTPVFFSHPIDGYFGRTLSITTTGSYAMDIDVKVDAQKADFVEIAVKTNGEAPFYAHIHIRSKDGSSEKLAWLKFYPGPGKPKQADQDEWVLYIDPDNIQGGWSIYKISLRDAVINTFGRDGWTYSGLQGFRVRGNLSLAYIDSQQSQSQ